MFAPSIKVDFEKLQQEEPAEEPRKAKAKATPKARAGARRPMASEASKSGKD